MIFIRIHRPFIIHLRNGFILLTAHFGLIHRHPIVHTHIHAAILHVHLHPILLHQIFGCIFLLVAGHCRSSHFHVHLGHLFHHRHFVGPIDGRCGKKRSLP